MKYIIIFLFLICGFVTQAQEVKVNDTTYEVRGGAIFKEGEDVTNTLTQAQQLEIRKALDQKLKKALENKEKEQAKAEKKAKKAEKEAKKAQKKAKKAEKALKQKIKAQERLEKAIGKLEDAQDKYLKLKNKGKLSPNDEAKWLKKIEKLRGKHQKAETKLKNI